MRHKAWRSIEAVRYDFFKSSIKLKKYKTALMAKSFIPCNNTHIVSQRNKQQGN